MQLSQSKYKKNSYIFHQPKRNVRAANPLGASFIRLSPKCIYHSMQSYVFYNKLLLAPNMLKRNVIYGILKISGHYNEMHGLIVNYKANPKCRDSNKEFALRYGQVLNKAIMLISEFEESAKGVKPWNDLYNYTFGSDYMEDCNEK